MRKWVSQRLHVIRWLQPGMGVKRWLLLLLFGVLLDVFGFARFAQLDDVTQLYVWFDAFRPAFVDVRQLAAVTLVAGLVVIVAAVYGLSRSLVAAFRRRDQADVVEVVRRHRQLRRGPKIVAIGGGHGLNTLLRGLKEHTDHITAIVTVADDGGSSGKLRRELGILPPGDFRNCIAALSDAEGLVGQLLQYRFGDDSGLDGHSFGNLYLTAMTAITGSFEAALEETSRVLAVRGKVLPSTLMQVTLNADLAPASGEDDGRWEQMRGESNIAAANRRIQRVYLEPEAISAYPAAVRAILEADLIVAGPGSLYTSVLPNLLVHDIMAAITASQAPKAYVCNVATQRGETVGYDVDDHVRALHTHIGSVQFGVVLANDTFPVVKPPGDGVDWVRLPETASPEYRLITVDLVDAQYPWRHDPQKLAQALMELISV